MKINIDTELLHVTLNEPLKDAKDGTVLTLGIACINALVIITGEDEGIDGKEKYIRYEIASKFSNGGDIELTSEEVVKIKELIGRMYAPLVVGPVYKLLEGLEQ